MRYTPLITNAFNTVRRSSLFKASGIYTLSSFINASIPFLLLPLLTKYLSRADFGIVSMFTTFTGLIMPFIGINMEGAIARRFYSEKKSIATYIGNCILLSVASFLVVLSICFLFLDKISYYTGIGQVWVLLGVLYCFCQFICLVLLTLYQVNQKPVKYGIVQVAQSILNFSFTAVLIFAFGLKWEGRLIAMIAASVLFAIIVGCILLYTKNVVFKPDFSLVKHALKFGGGLIPHALGASLISLTNRFFLLHMISIEESGLFSLAFQVGSIISFFTISFNNAFVPWLFDKLTNGAPGIKFRIVKLTYIYFLCITVFSLCFYICMPVFFRLFINNNFDVSLKYSFWIILGFVFQGMYFMVTNYISYSEKTYYLAFITLSVGLINIPANYFFINQFGAIGSAMAFSCSFFLLFVFTWLLSSKVYKMPWFVKPATNSF